MHQGATFYGLLKTDPEKGFRKLYLFQKGIKIWLRQNSADPEECKDIIHDSMLAFYEYSKKKNFEVDINPEQLLFGIAKNIWYKRLRHKRNMPPDALPELISLEPDMEEILEKELQYKKAAQALANLGHNCRALLFMYYFKNLSLEQIALKLGFNNAHVAKSMKYQCLGKAKNLIFK
jgi:RNA polymerase sigma factor (sigma-70 family)